MSADIKIYIANLGKYNEGESVGEWFDLPINDIAVALKKIGVAPNTYYEEYAIHDYEINIKGLKIGEYENLKKLNEQVTRLKALDTWDLKKLCAIIEAEALNLGEALEYLKDYDLYAERSLVDLAAEFVDDGVYGAVSPQLKIYIDYQAMARDLAMEDFTETCYGVLKGY